MSDPRNNPDDAYAVMMKMEHSEWIGLIGSLVKGGVLTPAEQEGFARAAADRAMKIAREDASKRVRAWLSARAGMGGVGQDSVLMIGVGGKTYDLLTEDLKLLADYPEHPVYEEFEASMTMGRYGPEYTDPRLTFEDTYCQRCGAQIGPGLGEDEDGRQYEHWTICFDGPIGLVCEDCANELDPPPVSPEELSR